MTNLCEPLYSTMKIINSKYHSNLIYDLLIELLKTALISMQLILRSLWKKLHANQFNLMFIFYSYLFTIYIFLINVYQTN